MNMHQFHGIRETEGHSYNWIQINRLQNTSPTESNMSVLSFLFFQLCIEFQFLLLIVL